VIVKVLKQDVVCKQVSMSVNIYKLIKKIMNTAVKSARHERGCDCE